MFHQARNSRNQRWSFPGYIGLHLWLEAPTWGQHFFWERAVHRLRKKFSPIAINPVFTTTPCIFQDCRHHQHHCHHHSCVDGSHCQEVLINTVIKQFFISIHNRQDHINWSWRWCHWWWGWQWGWWCWCWLQVSRGRSARPLSDPSLYCSTNIRSQLGNRLNPTWTFAPPIWSPPDPTEPTPDSLNGHLLLLSLYRMIAQILEGLSQICHWHSSRSQDLWLEYEI